MLLALPIGIHFKNIVNNPSVWSRSRSRIKVIGSRSYTSETRCTWVVWWRCGVCRRCPTWWSGRLFIRSTTRPLSRLVVNTSASGNCSVIRTRPLPAPLRRLLVDYSVTNTAEFSRYVTIGWFLPERDYVMLWSLLSQIRLSSVTFVRPTQGIETFDNISSPVFDLRTKFYGDIPSSGALTLSVPHFSDCSKTSLPNHSGPYWSNPPFFNSWHSGSLALSPERQRARMSKIKKWWVRPVWPWTMDALRCNHLAPLGFKGLNPTHSLTHYKDEQQGISAINNVNVCSNLPFWLLNTFVIIISFCSA